VPLKTCDTVGITDLVVNILSLAPCGRGKNFLATKELRNSGEGLIVEKFSSLEVEFDPFPLLRGEGRKSMRDSSIRFSGEVSTRRECHTALDAVSHGLRVEQLRSLEVEKKYRHCERSEFTPEAIQLNVGQVCPTYSPSPVNSSKLLNSSTSKLLPPLKKGGKKC